VTSPGNNVNLSVTNQFIHGSESGLSCYISTGGCGPLGITATGVTAGMGCTVMITNSTHNFTGVAESTPGTNTITINVTNPNGPFSVTFDVRWLCWS
jgi:hypothetical protein